MIEVKEPQTRDIPLWLTALVLLACLGGGGLLIRWYMDDRPRQSVDITNEVKNSPIPTGRGGSGNPFRGMFNGSGGGGGGNQGFARDRTPPRDLSLNGIQPFGSSSFRVKSGNTVMIAPAGGTGKITLSYFKPVRTSEQEQLASMFISVRGESAWRDYLGITDAQRKLFDNVPPGLSGAAPMKYEEADLTQMVGLWKTHQAATKGTPARAEAEKALLQGLDAVGKKNLEVTKNYDEQRSNAIRAALTPEQVKKFLSYGSDRPPLRTPASAAPVITRTTGTARTLATTAPTTKPTVKPAAAPATGELLTPAATK